MTTQNEEIMKEIGTANAAVQDWLSIEQQVALSKFVQHIMAAVELSKMDYRLIEGDDEREILGY